MTNKDKNADISRQTKDAGDSVSQTSINIFTITSKIDSLMSVLNDPTRILEENMIKLLLDGVEYTDVTPQDQSIIVQKIYDGLKVRRAQTPKTDIARALTQRLGKDVRWDGINCYVGEEDNKMYILQKDKKGNVTGKEFVSNFSLVPAYTLEVKNQELRGRYYIFDLVVAGRSNEKYTVKLTASDFESMKELQSRLKEQVGEAGCMLHDVYNHMRGVAHRYITLGADALKNVKKGTVVLGYERLADDGEKYFCSPSGAVYDINGSKSEDLVYMGDNLPTADVGAIRSLSNLDYDQKTWETEIMPGFLKNLMKLHTKENMLLVAGWMAAVPHEFNVRHVFEAFPLLHIAGKQGAGKSTIIQAIKPFLGYKSNTLSIFPSAAAMVKASTLGYTIISTFDEYGGSSAKKGWTQQRFNDVHMVMKSTYAKEKITKLGKGDGGQGSFEYKVRNCLVSIGQQFIADDSVASRSVQLHVFDAFHKTDAGKEAKEASANLKDMKDKNFWVGFNLWCMKQDDDLVKNTLSGYSDYVRDNNQKMGSRQQNVAATVMAGLFFLHKMAEEYGISSTDLGYTIEDIHLVPNTMQEVSEIANGGDEERSILHEFLNGIGNDAVAFGNTLGKMYGKGANVMRYAPTTDSDDGGIYSKTKEACVYGQDLILINIEEMCVHLNKRIGRDRYDPRDLNVYIQAEFQKSLLSRGKGLVLAPSGYRVSVGKGIKRNYTAFSATYLAEMMDGFDNNSFD